VHEVGGVEPLVSVMGEIHWPVNRHGSGRIRVRARL